jgi:hypothetical protein
VRPLVSGPPSRPDADGNFTPEDVYPGAWLPARRMESAKRERVSWTRAVRSMWTRTPIR